MFARNVDQRSFHSTVQQIHYNSPLNSIPNPLFFSKFEWKFHNLRKRETHSLSRYHRPRSCSPPPRAVACAAWIRHEVAARRLDPPPGSAPAPRAPPRAACPAQPRARCLDPAREREIEWGRSGICYRFSSGKRTWGKRSFGKGRERKLGDE